MDSIGLRYGRMIFVFVMFLIGVGGLLGFLFGLVFVSMVSS